MEGSFEMFTSFEILRIFSAIAFIGFVIFLEKRAVRENKEFVAHKTQWKKNNPYIDEAYSIGPQGAPYDEQLYVYHVVNSTGEEWISDGNKYPHVDTHVNFMPCTWHEELRRYYGVAQPSPEDVAHEWNKSGRIGYTSLNSI